MPTPTHRTHPTREPAQTRLPIPRGTPHRAPIGPYDPAKAEAFAERFTRALNDASLCLMASVGHRTGLFDAMRDQPPFTSHEIATHARLNERYVREWLGAMVTAKVVDFDRERETYRLPMEHAAVLTRAAASDNLAVFAQYLPLLGSVEDDIVACFRDGGGVPYARFPRFHEVMAEDSGLSVLAVLESDVLPLVPGLTQTLTRGARVLDAGCGRGRVLRRMAELFPKSRFVGMDLSGEAISAARIEAASRGLSNVTFVEVDLSDFHLMAEPESYDVITTFDAVHDQAKPLHLLRGIQRALHPDGVYLMQDIRGSSQVHENIDHPIGTFLYTLSCMHCMTVSLAQGGDGLGAMWGEQLARQYLQRAGFRSVEVHQLPHDVQNSWYVVRK